MTPVPMLFDPVLINLCYAQQNMPEVNKLCIHNELCTVYMKQHHVG